MLDNHLIYKQAILIFAPIKYGIIHNFILFLLVPIIIFLLFKITQHLINAHKINLNRLIDTVILLTMIGTANIALITLLTFNYIASYVYLQNLAAICIFYLSAFFTFGLLFITFEFTYKIIISCKPRWRDSHKWLDRFGVLLSSALSIWLTSSIFANNNKLINEFDLIWISGLMHPIFVIILRVMFIIITAGISIKAFNTIVVNNLKRKIGTQGIAGNVTNILQNLFTTIVVVATLFLILKEFYVNITPFITGLGIVGIGLGWILQQPLQDLAGCIFVILEDVIHIDDIIELPNKFIGKVEQLTLRTLKIRSLTGELHIIPYHKLEIITNHTSDRGYAMLDIPVAYSTNIQQAIDAIEETIDTLKQDMQHKNKILGPMEMFGVNSLADSAVIIRFRVLTAAHDKWSVSCMLNKKIKEKFDQIGIRIPFPQRELHIIQETQSQPQPQNSIATNNKTQS